MGVYVCYIEYINIEYVNRFIECYKIYFYYMDNFIF